MLEAASLGCWRLESVIEAGLNGGQALGKGNELSVEHVAWETFG